MNDNQNDLYALLGGTPGDAFNAIAAIINAIDVDGDPDGVRHIHQVITWLAQRANDALRQKPE